MVRQYVEVRYREGDRRTYCYHNDGNRVAVGDQVKVPGRSDEGWMRVTVVQVHSVEPKFPTKAIIGKVEAEDQADG